jgi:small conductance mechanosensitive channel
MSFTIILLFIVLISSIVYNQKKRFSYKKNIILFSLIISIVTAISIGYIYYKPSQISYVYSINIQENVPMHIIGTVGTLILTYLSTIALDSATQKMVEKDGRQVVDEHRREVIFRILQLTVYAFVAIGLLNYWNINIRNILIGAGALAAIIGLSARHTLSAALSGIILLFSRPFKVGDWIEVEDTEGTVRRITIINTILQTPKDEEVVIPNDVIGETTIKNKNKTNKLRVSIEVEAAYEEDSDMVLKVAENSIKDCDIIADIPEPTAHIQSFKNSGVLIDLHFWIRKPTPRRKTVAMANANKIIKDSFDEHGIEIPYPKRDLNHNNYEIHSSLDSSQDEESKLKLTENDD